MSSVALISIVTRSGCQIWPTLLSRSWLPSRVAFGTGQRMRRQEHVTLLRATLLGARPSRNSQVSPKRIYGPTLYTAILGFVRPTAGELLVKDTVVDNQLRLSSSAPSNSRATPSRSHSSFRLHELVTRCSRSLLRLPGCLAPPCIFTFLPISTHRRWRRCSCSDPSRTHPSISSFSTLANLQRAFYQLNYASRTAYCYFHLRRLFRFIPYRTFGQWRKCEDRQVATASRRQLPSADRPTTRRTRVPSTPSGSRRARSRTCWTR